MRHIIRYIRNENDGKIFYTTKESFDLNAEDETLYLVKETEEKTEYYSTSDHITFCKKYFDKNEKLIKTIACDAHYIKCHKIFTDFLKSRDLHTFFSEFLAYTATNAPLFFYFNFATQDFMRDVEEWIASAFLYAEEYDLYWTFKYGYCKNRQNIFDVKYTSISFDDIINIKFNAKNSILTYGEFISVVKRSDFMTPWAKENCDYVNIMLQLKFESFVKKNGTDIVSFWLKKWIDGNTEDFAAYKELASEHFSKTEQAFKKSKLMFNKSNYISDVKSGISSLECRFKLKEDYLFLYGQNIAIETMTIHNSFSFYFYAILKTWFREFENVIREERGLPRIGEGWITETQLYYQLKDYFKNCKVIQHGSPNWLGRQHLDIYFPEFNIGVEYQGIQHLQPVDFFGGEKAFKENQKRDERKRNLCKANMCRLIYVYEGYNLSDITSKIEEFMLRFKFDQRDAMIQ